MSKSVAQLLYEPIFVSNQENFEQTQYFEMRPTIGKLKKNFMKNLNEYGRRSTIQGVSLDPILGVPYLQTRKCITLTPNPDSNMVAVARAPA